MVTDLWCMPCSSRIISGMLCEIHTMEKYDSLKPIMHFEIINSVLHVKRVNADQIAQMCRLI